MRQRGKRFAKNLDWLGKSPRHDESRSPQLKIASGIDQHYKWIRMTVETYHLFHKGAQFVSFVFHLVRASRPRCFLVLIVAGLSTKRRVEWLNGSHGIRGNVSLSGSS